MTNKTSRKVRNKSLKTEPKLSTKPFKNKTKNLKKEQVKVSKILPIVNDINEDEIELSEQDVEFFKEHDQFTKFLKDIDKVALHKNEIINIKKSSVKAVKNDKTDQDSLPSLTSSDEEGDDEMIIVGDLNQEKMYISSDSDIEQEYERTPRLNKSWIHKESTKLPIKLPDGKIKQKEVVICEEERTLSMNVDKNEPSINDIDEPNDLDTNDKKSQVSEPMLSINIPLKEYINQKKEQLAEIAQRIVEDPENNIGQLKDLREIATDKNLTVKKLAILSQFVVYKDIIPGYRIRQLTDRERPAQVSKEVKKIRNYEQGLLSNYQAYLKFLESELRGSRQKEPLTKEEEKSVADEALQCMCGLLTSVTHFNFRLNLMTAIVTRMSTRKFTKMTAMCCDAIIEVFKNDESGEASLDAVKLITMMIKSKSYVVHEEVLNTFLHLRLRDELNIKKLHEDEAHSNKKRKWKKEPKKHLSRKMRKLEKERKEIENEMKEAEAVVDYEEKEKRHTETLKLVFITYFRILKHANKSPLLLSVLEGLSKFAHLINVDFFNDLLELLKRIMADEIKVEDSDPEDSNTKSSISRINTRKGLLCIITAFQLLSGQGEALNIDLKDFYTQMYTIIMPLALNPYMEKSELEQLKADEGKVSNATYIATEQELLMKGIDFILFKRKQIPTDRSAAFLKRLSIACMNWPSKTVLKCLTTMKKMIQRQSRLDALLSSDDRAVNGIYRPDLNDPELCNPFATSLWELNLLQKHYDPKIRTAAVQLATFESNVVKSVN
ncbi:10740_t:CDS:10 [Funneliformis mosseae]|uniref:Nucleolar complex-associated protein 3 n=1 Tax=Funneliformis mosseae TaxID=27381 RepID=A0A9N8V6T6_FUNMO|nr:10740_t:CDS:10 [Funneliformis mosseae]